MNFTQYSLEKYIVDDSVSQDNPDRANESLLEQHRADMEQVLNIEMLSQPPYSLINLPENLLPLSLSSDLDELLSILEEYDQNQEGLEILEVTLKNLQGDLKDSLNYAWKWNLINNNQVWAKKAWLLIQQLIEEKNEVYQNYKAIQLLMEDVLQPMLSLAQASDTES